MNDKRVSVTKKFVAGRSFVDAMGGESTSIRAQSVRLNDWIEVTVEECEQLLRRVPTGLLEQGTVRIYYSGRASGGFEYIVNIGLERISAYMSPSAFYNYGQE